MGCMGKRKCAFCNKEVLIYDKKRLFLENVFCSQKCFNNYKIEKNKNCKCPICGKLFHSKKSHIEKCKNIYCSRECFREAKKEYMKGEGNHQYGLKGCLNSSWKSDRKISTYGYILIRQLDHPFCTKGGFVFEHRLVAEKFLLNDKNSVEIKGKKYLSPDFCVHHIDGNKQNNNVDNLKILSLKEHASIHSKNRGCKRVAKINENEEIIEMYNSIKEAALQNNLCPQNISQACKNQQRTCGGFKWKFL